MLTRITIIETDAPLDQIAALLTRSPENREERVAPALVPQVAGTPSDRVEGETCAAPALPPPPQPPARRKPLRRTSRRVSHVAGTPSERSESSGDTLPRNPNLIGRLALHTPTAAPPPADETGADETGADETVADEPAAAISPSRPRPARRHAGGRRGALVRVVGRDDLGPLSIPACARALGISYYLVQQALRTGEPRGGHQIQKA